MSNAPLFTVSDYILTRLYQLGLRYLFAVPGDYASDFMLTLDDFEGITRIGNINELGAGYAADGYARFRGIGAVCLQYGVGNFSVLNATAGSYVERVPVVVLSPSPSANDRALTKTEGILFHHSTGNLAADKLVFENVTVASEIVHSAASAPQQVDRALVAALTHRRPVYIEVLQNVYGEACDQPKGELAPLVPKSNVAALEAALEAAWRRISKARAPVIWAGVEIQRFGLQDTLQNLVDATGFPFTTTSLGKTVLDESQPQFIGTYAGPASPELTRKVMDETDCVIALGTIITDDYLDIMASDYGNMILSDDEQLRIGHQFYREVYLNDFLEGLVARARADENCPKKFAPPSAETKQPVRAGDSESLTYNIFFDELFAFFHENKLMDEIELVLGESTSLYVAGNYGGLPRDGFVANAAWGSLGHETGCAMGVALGSGKRPFVVAGDGGFMMMSQALSPMSRYGIGAVVFVMSNRVYAIEQAFINLDAFEPGGEFAGFDELATWDYQALATAYGAKGYRAATVGELRSVLAKAKENLGGPSLLEIVIPKTDLAPQLKRLAEDT